METYSRQRIPDPSIRGKTVVIYNLTISRIVSKNDANYQASHENKEKQLIQPVQMYIIQSNTYNAGLNYETSQRVMPNNYWMLCTIWYHLHKLKNIKNTLGGVLL